MNKYKGKVLTLIIFTMSLFSINVHSAIGVEAERIRIGPNQDTITYNVHYWDEDDPTPSPCIGSTFCYVAVGWHYEGQAGTLAEPLVVSTQQNIKTVGEIGRLYREKFGMPHSGTKSGTTIGNRPGEKICFAMKYRASGTSSITYPALMPGNTCTYIDPVEPNACYIHGPVNLTHGTISASEANGHRTTTTVSISCAQPAYIKVSVPNNKVVLNSSGLTSIIYVNGNSNGEGYFSIGSTNENINIESQLSADSVVREGEFSGSTIMITEII